MAGTGRYSGWPAISAASPANQFPALMPTAHTSRARVAMEPLLRFVPTPIARPLSLMPSSPSRRLAPRMMPSTEAAVARYAKCDVLVLDDLGKEDATEWSVGTVFSVLDARYEDMRPTIVTSNYAPGALADRLARRGERVTAEAIASRISQTCRPVYLGGRDRRRRG